MKSILEDVGQMCILAKTKFSIKVVGGTLGISGVVNMAKYRVFDIGHEMFENVGKTCFAKTKFSKSGRGYSRDQQSGDYLAKYRVFDIGQ